MVDRGRRDTGGVRGAPRTFERFDVAPYAVDQGVREPQDRAAQDFGPLVATPPAGTNGIGVYGAAIKDSPHDRTHSSGTDQLHC